MIYLMSQRKWKLIKWGTVPLSLYLDWRLRKPKRRRAPDIVMIDFVMSRAIPLTSLEPFSEKERQRYIDATSRTIYWHGTGRLQYDRQGGTVDVLEQMLKRGGVQPFKDVFDIKHGEMFSISVARQRMYARIYADMHVHGGANLRERYGRPRFWMYYFIMAVNLHATRELGLWNPKTRRTQHAAWRKQGKEVWAAKVHQNPSESAGKFFDNGSDIAGNYPILIGIKRADHTFLKTADYVARYESRIGSNVPVEAFTHLEVPKAKLVEVQKLLKKYGYTDTPAFAFEQCEQLQASRLFSELVFQSNRE
jgi:hypothetical protein